MASVSLQGQDPALENAHEGLGPMKLTGYGSSLNDQS